MVSTRNHPRNFPPPLLSPTKSSSASSPDTSLVVPPKKESNGAATITAVDVQSRSKSPVARTRRRTRRATGWSHIASRGSLIWLGISVPLVIMDFIYVLLRPHTFRDGPLFWPFYVPYDWYGRVDLLYGQGAYKNQVGFTAAQSVMNIFETALYIAYLYLVAKDGAPLVAKKAKGARAQSFVSTLFAPRAMTGETGATAIVLVLAGYIMTLSKTVLYWLNEYYSNYAAVGHNRGFELVFWLLINGVWIVFPAYYTYVLSVEIIEGLILASKVVKPE